MDASIEFFKKTLMKQVNELKEAEKLTKEKLIVQRRQLFTQLEWIQNWLTFLSGEGFITQNVELFYSSELADVVMPKAQPPIENIMEVFLPSSGTSSSSSVMMSIEEAEKIADHCEEILCPKQLPGPTDGVHLAKAHFSFISPRALWPRPTTSEMFKAWIWMRAVRNPPSSQQVNRRRTRVHQVKTGAAPNAASAGKKSPPPKSSTPMTRPPKSVFPW